MLTQAWPYGDLLPVISALAAAKALRPKQNSSPVISIGLVLPFFILLGTVLRLAGSVETFAVLHDAARRARCRDRQITLPEAKAAYEVAIGRRVILADHKDDQQVTPKSLKQWLAAMADEEELASKTINGVKVQAQAFWAYLLEHEIVKHEPNPFTATSLAVPKTARKQTERMPFTPDEVVGFLRSPVVLKDAQLSLLITLAMYTGARIEELAMLKKAALDFEQEVIRFRGTKTKAADRQVPMHPVLIPLLSTVSSDGQDEYVIVGLTIDARGERGKAIGKRFGRLKTDMGFGDEKVFHSIRKTVSTLFEQAEVLEGVAADILGHEKQTMTYGLYSGGSSLKQKREAIHKLKYPTAEEK
jgi:integrase